MEAKHIIVEQKRDLKKLKINRQQLYNEVIQPGKAYIQINVCWLLCRTVFLH